jgi:hypothetical protein
MSKPFRTTPLAAPFGSPAHLMARVAQGAERMPTRQDAAIIVCGGGDPFAEASKAEALCAMNDVPFTTFIGNDQIARWPYHADHCGTLHPDKMVKWRMARSANGYEPIEHIWTHRPFTSFNHWTRDWAGSTGLFLVKIAREMGFVHIILCGVHMSPDSGHFVRQVKWDACDNFKKAWVMRMPTLRPYLRSYGGWTMEEFGEPDAVWLTTPIEDKHPNPKPPTWGNKGTKA